MLSGSGVMDAAKSQQAAPGRPGGHSTPPNDATNPRTVMADGTPRTTLQPIPDGYGTSSARGQGALKAAVLQGHAAPGPGERDSHTQGTGAPLVGGDFIGHGTQCSATAPHHVDVCLSVAKEACTPCERVAGMLSTPHAARRRPAAQCARTHALSSPEHVAAAVHALKRVLRVCTSPRRCSREACCAPATPRRGV